MNVIQVVPYIGDLSAGTATCIPPMCQSLAKQGARVALHTLAPLPDLGKVDFQLFGYSRSRFPHPRLGRSPEMKRALLAAGAHADIIHSNGLWMAPNVYPYLAAKKHGVKFVVMPHGTVAPYCWKISTLKKKLCWWMGQRDAFRQADMYVATAESEFRDLRDLGLHQPIALLPNGIDIPEQTYAKSDCRTMLFLSRIHPKKGVQSLICAWKKLQNDFPDWDLKIAGPVTPYAVEMQKLAAQIGCARLEFCGEVLGDAKLQLMASSECLILPTHSENFGMVVAEALAAGTAAICTTGAPWAGLNTHDCGISCACDDDAIENAMRKVMASSRAENIARGQRGRAWMQRDFSWDDIGRKLFIAYQWLLGEADQPEWVLTK